MAGVAVGLSSVLLLSVAGGDQVYTNDGEPEVFITTLPPRHMVVSGVFICTYRES